MRYLRFLLGAVFCLSALFKLQDPVGLELIMQDYFNFFHLGFLSPLAKVVGLVVAFCEAAIGVLLVSRYKFRVLDIVTSVFIVFFFLLTLVLLIVNPDIECGCFGQVVPLSHLGTFLKNVALLLVGGVVFWRAFTPSYLADVAAEDLLWGCRALGVKPNLFHRIKAGVLAVLIVGFSVYPLVNLPLRDYTAFRQGNVFVGAADEDFPEKEELVFLYAKDGVTQEFTMDNLPDTSWTFVDMRKIEGGPERPVLSVRDRDDVYCEEDLMTGKVMLVSLYKRPSKRKVALCEEFLERCAGEGLRVVVISDKDYERCPAEYFADRRTLQALNRANLGATYIDNGRIISKYSPATYPSDAALAHIAEEESEAVLLEQLTPFNLVYNLFYLLVAVLIVI